MIKNGKNSEHSSSRPQATSINSTQASCCNAFITKDYSKPEIMYLDQSHQELFHNLLFTEDILTQELRKFELSL